MEWISVKERLPEEGQRVITYNKYESINMTYYGKHHHGDIHFLKNDIVGYDSDVTHWMPVPDPPE